VLVLIVVREIENLYQVRNETQQGNSASRCGRLGLHDFVFGVPNSAVGRVLLRLDFSISRALFDFGNFRFFPAQFVVSGLARPVTFGAFGVGQMTRAKSFDEVINCSSSANAGVK
jgi:hypothetical protein